MKILVGIDGDHYTDLDYEFVETKKAFVRR